MDMTLTIKSIELEGHASYKKKTFVGPFSPGLNVIAGEGSSGKTSILTALQWAVAGSHPPNYHESPAGKAGKVSVKIDLDTTLIQIPGDLGDQPKALEMSVSRDGDKKYLLGSSEFGSDGAHFVSTLIMRPKPCIWLLPQGMIASLLENHDSNLWGIFTEYVTDSNEVSKTLVSLENAQGEHKIRTNAVNWHNHVSEVLRENKGHEMTMIEAIQAEAKETEIFLETIRNKVLARQEATVRTMEKNHGDAELGKSSCDKYLQCLSTDYSTAWEQHIRIEAKQEVLSRKNSVETKESLKRELEHMDSKIKNEENEIIMLSELIKNKVEALPKEVMSFIALDRGWGISSADQVAEHEGFIQLLESSVSRTKDDINSIQGKIKDLTSRAEEPKKFKSMEQLEPNNPDFWSDISLKGGLYCDNHAKLKGYEANLSSKEAEEQKTLDHIEQQIRHRASIAECKIIKAAISSPSHISRLTRSDILLFYTTWNALSTDKSRKVWREANLVSLKAKRRKLAEWIWLLGDAEKMSRQALEAAEGKVLDCYECSQVAQRTSELAVAQMTRAKWEVGVLKGLECKLEATSAMHKHESVFTDPGKSENELENLNSEMLSIMKDCDEIDSYICELKSFEGLEELPEKFSEVFSSLVESCTGQLILEKDKEGKYVDLRVLVDFGNGQKAMKECDHMEKTVVVLCMILAIHLHENESRICLLDGIDANIGEPYKKALWQWIRYQSQCGKAQFIVTLNGRPEDTCVYIDKLFTVTSQGGESTVKNPTPS